MLREVIAAVVCAALFFVAGWTVNGWRKNTEIAQIQLEYTKKQADAEKVARDKEQNWVDQADVIRKAKDAEIATINHKFNTAIAGLRSRPERSSNQVPGATPACAGSSGAGLARGDGEFLAGYAADAARTEAALEQCEAQYNQLRN